MNRLLLHIILAAFLWSCSQHSESAKSADEAAPQEESEVQQEVTTLDQEQQTKDAPFEKDELGGLIDQELEANQKKKVDKFVNLFAQQKMEEFFDLYFIYTANQTDPAMKEVATIELQKLILPEAWTSFDSLEMEEKVKSSKLKLLETNQDTSAYLTQFSFKLNGEKYKSEALIQQETNDYVETWSFKILSIEKD